MKKERIYPVLPEIIIPIRDRTRLPEAKTSAYIPTTPPISVSQALGINLLLIMLHQRTRYDTIIFLHGCPALNGACHQVLLSFIHRSNDHSKASHFFNCCAGNILEG